MGFSLHKRTNVFISYSHKDDKYLKGFLPYLKYYEQHKLIDYWADTKIKPGENWQKEIEKALASAKVAVLLISIDFLVSQFIVDNELPPLLAAAEAEGLTILPVVLRPCTLPKSLSQFQAINSPSSPLAKMKGYQREELWVNLANSIMDTLNPQTPVDSPSEVKTREVLNIASNAAMSQTVQQVVGAKVLWVDDNPSDNYYERNALEALGIQFTISTSTEDALGKVRFNSYDAIISDMGRQPPDHEAPFDRQAGYTLLEELQKRNISTSFIIYAGSSRPEHKAETLRRGGFGTTGNAQELYRLVIDAIKHGRTA